MFHLKIKIKKKSIFFNKMANYNLPTYSLIKI